MPRYWIIAPVESQPADLFDKVWQYDLKNNLISIGWKELGDISEMNRDELSQAIATAYSDKPQQTKGLYANMVWAFYHEINIGDYVIARRGRKTLAAVGRVNKTAFYSPGKNPEHEHPNFLEVTWQEQPRDTVFPFLVFPMHTLTETTEGKFKELVPDPDPDSIIDTVENSSEFALEKYLEDFIVSNFDAIFKGNLKIFKDDEGNDGQQYSTDIGIIDILATEPKSKSFVVIELKKGRPSDQVVGQVLRYMGWVKKNLCTNNQSVKGLVICREPDSKLTYALEMTSNVDIRFYNVSFKLYS